MKRGSNPRRCAGARLIILHEADLLTAVGEGDRHNNVVNCMRSAVSKSSTLCTLGAIPLTLIVWSIVSTLASVASFMLDNAVTLIRPGVNGFFANIFGAVVGVAAAKAAADHWLPGYSGKIVAIFFFAACAAALFGEWFVLADPGHPIQVTAAGVTSVRMAYHGFWHDHETA